MHSAENIKAQVEALATTAWFDEASQRLVDSWSDDNVGFEAVEPILCLMERCPDIDYGSPGPLVHFMERFYRQGYEEAVLVSVARRPTEHTTWLLNRLINGARELPEKCMLIEAIRRIAGHPAADESTLRSVSQFLGRLA